MVFTCKLLLKVLPFTKFAPAHQTQIIHYLKCWRKRLGLLVNFGPSRAKIERIVWDEPALDIHEDYDDIVRSVLDRPSPYEFIRTRTYIDVLGLQFGFVVNFGKKQLQIYGIQAT